MKKILGLDLGTTSIGWAFVHEAVKENERSKIINTGVRVVPLTTDEETDFSKGKAISVNSDRTLKRGMRRNLDRYQLRRKNLIEILLKYKVISNDTELNETGKSNTHSTYAIRSKAASNKIELCEFAKVLLMINKKRGYKSSRKAVNEEEGQAIDGMHIARELYERGITPGQFVNQKMKEGAKFLPDFYRSDLKNEFDTIWSYQAKFYPETLTDQNKEALEGKGKRDTSIYFYKTLNIELAENKGKRDEIKSRHYEWRSNAVSNKISLNELASVFTEINNNINSSSGYLGEISDRSKELFFRKLTVGQYQYQLLQEQPNTSQKNMVFYRQDYLDEFETIWEVQNKHHPILTDELKAEIRDVIIFYQRRLKSQKHLLSVCEFEKHHKVCPKSSPLFQEYKIWQIINNLEFINLKSEEKYGLSQEDKTALFDLLNIHGKHTKKELLKFLGKKGNDWEINYDNIEGNNTQAALWRAYVQISEMIGGVEIDMNKLTIDEIKEELISNFEAANINTAILSFDSSIEGNEFDKQASYQLWHLLYSSEDQKDLIDAVHKRFGFSKDFASIISRVTLQADHGSLSARAIKKIMPYLMEGHAYDQACLAAGYNHSSSKTKEELASRVLKDALELLPKNSLRNSIVEKILNQMINLINAIFNDPEMGRPDEIRIELARELKKSGKERQEMTTNISRSQKEHEQIRNLLRSEFGHKRVTRNDIIRYKLYKELESNGYKTLYTNTYIPIEKLFSKEFDIEHIIPQSRLFDDSFSNKTLSLRKVNIEKGNDTAIDYLSTKLDLKGLESYKQRVYDLYQTKKIGRAKYQKLTMPGDKIPEGFIERDLRNSQYIAKKAKTMLEEVVREVSATAGSITSRLRKDWQLENIMQELVWDKYDALGLTYYVESKDGNQIKKIKDWSKRNDHRHHAMDAITVAFTKKNYVQYLNNLNAKSDKSKSIYGIEKQELYKPQNGRLKFKPPFALDDFRADAKKQLNSILVSFKAKNKVVTRNKNRIKVKGSHKTQICLTPRGFLHKETIYGRSLVAVTKVEKVGSKFDLETINKVAKPKYKAALLERLADNDNNPKLAFAGKNAPAKHPIWLDELHTTQVPEKVKLVWHEYQYTIRKDVTPGLKLDKVIDIGIRRILQTRLDEYGGKDKVAFANLDTNPIWIDQDKGICIKRVTISGVNNVESLHEKRDHFGGIILDKGGKPIPSDFVSTGNNHHVAIYRDGKGNLQEEVVSFYEAVARAKVGLSIINKNHVEGWQFLFTMKQNEYFLFPGENFDPDEVDLLNPENAELISKHLFRVQKISTKNYVFNHHLETSAVNSDTLKNKVLSNVTYFFIQSTQKLEKIKKVRINHLGKIVHVGEY